jgi:hypothetical protein
LIAVFSDDSILRDLSEASISSILRRKKAEGAALDGC